MVKIMKNKELIRQLLQMNMDADVSLTTCNDICISYISKGGATKKTTKQIFIEEANWCESCAWHDGGGYCTAYDKQIEDVEECYQHCEE